MIQQGLKLELSPKEQAIKDGALAFAREHKKVIARRETDRETFASGDYPVSVFMAGSPGAGKTEASIELLKPFSKDGSRIIRIDPDELRTKFKDYNGENSWLFQGAISILVDKIHDLALKQKQSFLLDGTLTNYEIAQKNIERSLRKKRVVQILYIYQKPELAWEFVMARECAEGRRIPPNHFIDQYFGAREVVNALKKKFGSKIAVDLLLKNNDNSNRAYKAGIDAIDNHVPEKYTRSSLEELIQLK